MQRLIREFVIAIAGAVVAGVLLSLFTDLSRVQLVLVALGILIVCGLVLTGLRLPGFVGRRYQACRAGLVDEVVAQVRAGLPQSLPACDTTHTKQSFADIPIRVDPATRLSGLLEAGRVLQGSLRRSESGGNLLDSDVAAELGQWEGRARAALVHAPRDFAIAFDNTPDFNTFGQTYGEAYRRVDAQLTVLEEAIRKYAGKPTR